MYPFPLRLRELILLALGLLLPEAWCFGETVGVEVLWLEVYIPFMVAEANVSVLLIRSQMLAPFASDLTDLPADDLAREDGLPSFFLEVVSMSPFICADANVSVYAILEKKALDDFVVLGADADLDLG